MTVILVGTGPPRLTSGLCVEPRGRGGGAGCSCGRWPCPALRRWGNRRADAIGPQMSLDLGTTGDMARTCDGGNIRARPEEAQVVATDVNILDLAESLRQRLVPSDLESTLDAIT